MKCPTCNSDMEAGAKFCGVCGNHLPDTPIPGLGAPAAGAPVMAAPSDPYIGQLLNNRFQVESKLGEGGFGAVYKGTQKVTNRSVALKLLHPEMTRDENLVARFRREGLVLCNLKDAHTITTYDFDQTQDGTLYIAMELLEGRSLHDVFHSDAPVDWERMLTIMSQMCSSLAEAHEQGIVHRDLKPENVHLEKRSGNPEFVKILDFGIAKVMHGDAGGLGGGSPQLTATGQTLGTLEYMSPEQLMGKQLDGRSDVYAMGVVAFELMTGRLPFPDAKGPAGLITAQLRKTPPAPSTANPKGSIPREVDQLIAKMLEKDKKNRHENMTELRAAIDNILALHKSGELGRTQTPVPQVQRTPTPVPAAPPRASTPAPAPRAQTPAPAPAPAPGKTAPTTKAALAASQGNRTFMWVVIGILAVGAAVGAVFGLMQ